MNKPSFVFFGTPDVASKTLELLKEAGYLPELIITAPDRPVGRHFTMTPPPAKAWALENNIPYLQPEKITDEVIAALPRTDLFIVVAYGKILPERLITLPNNGTLNIHYSLLPRWRGASPVEAAILHGDQETGVSIQRMVFKLDAGPVIAEERTPIDPNETHEELRNRLIPMGAQLLVKLLPLLRESTEGREGTPQDESLATHCGKIKKEDGLVDPRNDDPRTLWNKYRAYHGWPGLHYFSTPSAGLRPVDSPLAGGEKPVRIKITAARFEHGTFIIERIIPEGKKEIIL